MKRKDYIFSYILGALLTYAYIVPPVEDWLIVMILILCIIGFLSKD